MKGYTDADFMKNSYRMYYRTYPRWTLDCQNAFSTEDVSQVGMQTSSYSSLSYSIMLHSIVLYVLLLVTCASSTIKFVIYLAASIASGVYISLLAHYAIALTRMQKVNISLI